MVSNFFLVGPAVLMYDSPDPILDLEQSVSRLCTERLSAGPDACLLGHVFPAIDCSSRQLHHQKKITEHLIETRRSKSKNE